VVIKLGPQGAYVADRAGRATVPGFQVPRVVDTVGAGDGFAVGVLSGLLDGLNLVDAALRGNAIGARVVQYVGDSEGLPNTNELAHEMQGAVAIASTN
jgi:2-dehydro-3-deoxygluconokinase